jgi:hypothetical protein
MKTKKSVMAFTAMLTLILANFGVSKIRNDCKSVNNLSALIFQNKIYMKKIYLIILIFCAGCTNGIKIKVNDSAIQFNLFPSTGSLTFTALSDELLEEPATMILYQDKLIIGTFCKGHDKHVAIFSLDKNRILKEMIGYGQGPEEMLSCKIGLFEDKIWLYDMTKRRIGIVAVDSFLMYKQPVISQHRLELHYYTVAMFSDSIILGTNDLTSSSKISYINLNTNSISVQGDYAYLPDDTPLSASIDAASCYVAVNPVTKDILLSYRYTDMIEIYTPDGKLKHALHGPMGFDIDFQAQTRENYSFMAKTRNTRKAYVDTPCVTEKNIYLLFSGCKRNEENWSSGTELHVFSWDGRPLKRYLLEEPLRTFVIDESRQIIYAYSLITEELIKAKL